MSKRRRLPLPPCEMQVRVLDDSRKGRKAYWFFVSSLNRYGESAVIKSKRIYARPLTKIRLRIVADASGPKALGIRLFCSVKRDPACAFSVGKIMGAMEGLYDLEIDAPGVHYEKR